MGVRHMQGVPAQLETLHTTDTDKKRRHPAHCIFAEGKGGSRICTNPQSPLYYQHCGSASKCDFYEEKSKSSI